MDKGVEMTSEELRILKKKIAIRFSLFPVFFLLIFLLTAGSFDYWQAYIYLAVLIIPMIFVFFYFLKKDPKFLERRTKGKEKEKEQKIFQFFSSILMLSGFIIPGLDLRFGWSDVPVWLILTADIIVLLGYLMIFFVFRQNSYASRTIEVEDNQKLITTGLYGFVRHPMYTGMSIMFLATPVALGSYPALIPFCLFIITMIYRLLNEEKVLLERLQGYKEYCLKTKYRLIPFIW